MENNNLMENSQTKKQSTALIVILAILCVPLAIPLLFIIGSLLFAGGVTFVTLLGTGSMLLFKSVEFLISLELFFFAKAFFGGLSLLAVCTLPIVAVVVLIKSLIKNK